MRANNAEPQSANPIRSPSLQPTDGSVHNSSRFRFGLYRKQVKQNEPNKAAYHSSGDVRRAKDRVRSSAHLAWQFLRLLIPYRWQNDVQQFSRPLLRSNLRPRDARWP